MRLLIACVYRHVQPILAGDDLHGARRSDDALSADAFVDRSLEDKAVGIGVEWLHRQRADALLEEGVHLVDVLGRVVARGRRDVVDAAFRGRLLHAASEGQEDSVTRSMVAHPRLTLVMMVSS